MKTIRFLIGIICLCPGFLTNVYANNINADSMARQLMYQVWSYPQEKVYVVTDRDAYISGDSIRFRAFLVDASSHRKPDFGSKFIYLELINPFGKTETRVKIKDNGGKFAGIIPLSVEMPEGTYTLCAYTQFMQNSGKEYFYRKSIPVFSQLSQKYKLETKIEDNMLTARLTEKSTGKPVRAEHISISGPNEEFFSARIRKRSSYSKRINKAMRDAGFVKVKFDKYEKFAAIPYDTVSISITFHPEGGYLIPDRQNKLAFKALDQKGLSVDFDGNIVDDTGETVSAIRSTHKGMGVVEFTPKAGKSYKVVVNDKSFPIPSAEPNASVINVESLESDSIIVKISGQLKKGCSLIAHNGGIVTLAQNIAKPEIRLKRDELGTGIVQFLLVDNRRNTLSSRMIFNHGGYMYNTPVDSLPSGDYTLRAYLEIEPDTTSSIVSNLLLQSELKGHIEDPDYYFRERDSIPDANLDLLMLTQGWERYDIPSSLKGEFARPEIPLEIGGEITGTVKSRWRSKPLADALVVLMAPKIEFATQTFTDEQGRFAFNGFDWPEDTSFIIQVLNKSSDKEHNYSVNEEIFPSIDIIETAIASESPTNIIDEQLLTDGTIMLEELEVTAPMSLEESRREMLAALGVRSYTSEEIEKMHITTYEEVLRKIPGLRVVNGNVLSTQSRGVYNSGVGGAPVEYWVDGSEWTPAFSYSSGSLSSSRAAGPRLFGASMQSEHSYSIHMNNTLDEFSGMYPIHIMKSIEYFKPSTAMIISISAAMNGGALVFTTKDGSEFTEWDHDLFIRDFSPLGYQDQPESYKPHFIYDPTSDDTVFDAAWLPVMSDPNDLPTQSDCYIIIEGFTNQFIPVTIRQTNSKVEIR